MSEGKYFSLIIDRMPEGGFVVTDGSYRRDPGSLSMPLFASTNIGEALAFIGDELAPRTGEIKGAAIGKPGAVGLAFTGV